MNVYIVTTGDYSDYSVEAVFTDEAIASSVAESMNGDVLTMNVWESMPTRKVVHIMHWTNKDFRGLEHEGERTEVVWPWDDTGDGTKSKPDIRITKWRDSVGLTVRGTDRRAVQQAFGDNKARIQAELAGIA